MMVRHAPMLDGVGAAPQVNMAPRASRLTLRRASSRLLMPGALASPFLATARTATTWRAVVACVKETRIVSCGRLGECGEHEEETRVVKSTREKKTRSWPPGRLQKMSTRPGALDVSEKSLQEQADEEFVNGVLGLSLSETSRRSRSRRGVDSKYGSLTSPTGELSDTKYIRTNFGALSRLPHQTTTAPGNATTTVACATTATAGFSLLENMKRGRAHIQHHLHARVSQQGPEDRRQYERQTGEPTGGPVESSLPSETASVVSFGTSISHASTRVIKEPMRPSWMPVRVGKSMGTRRVQGAGLLHVSGRAGKEQVDTSLRDKYETPRPIVPSQTRSGSRRSSVGRVGGVAMASTASTGSTLSSPAAATLASSALANLGGIDDAKELRRIFKLHLHTLPEIEGVKGLADGFETAALFRKPSKLTEAERKRIFAKLSALREDAVRQTGLSQRKPSDGASEGNDGEKIRGAVCEEIQSRLDRLGALAAHAEKAGFGQGIK